MSYISKNTRRLVVVRGGNRCEYCRVLDYLVGFEYHIEHIIGVQHGGTDALSNLAYACSYCNWKKGPNISTILDDELIPLFNQLANQHAKPTTQQPRSSCNRQL